MELDIFQVLTIVNSIILAILPFAFFRRQKLQEIKYKEIMELNVKTHDITTRVDRSLRDERAFYSNDADRLDYLISRYKKHSKFLSKEIYEYKEMWKSYKEKSKMAGVSKVETDDMIKFWLKKSETIRELADKLLK